MGIYDTIRNVCCDTEESWDESPDGGPDEEIQGHHSVRWLEAICQIHKAVTTMLGHNLLFQ